MKKITVDVGERFEVEIKQKNIVVCRMTIKPNEIGYDLASGEVEIKLDARFKKRK